MDKTHLIAFCTCPSQEVAERIAEHLVAAELAACVNMLPGITSIYRWRGATHRDAELLLLIKTTQQAYPALEQAIRQLHPYELPEIIAVGVEQGLPDYLRWMTEQTQARS